MKISKSIERSINILEAISESQGGLTLGEIQEMFLIPKSSAFDIIQTLLYTDMVSVVEGIQKKYIIGLKSFQIGLSYENDMLKLAKKHLKTLAEKLNKTIFLGIIKDGEVIYLDKSEPKSPIITTATLGTKNPVHCTGLGKIMLSRYTNRDIEKILLEKGMPKRTKYTLINSEDFITEIEKIRVQGYAIDNRELEENMLCISTPILDKNKKIVAAISASGFYNKHENISENVEIMKNFALEISREIGYKL
ncbi:MAG: IclR family transcriptional regulator [Fusobacteriaceae bacterium]